MEEARFQESPLNCRTIVVSNRVSSGTWIKNDSQEYYLLLERRSRSVQVTRGKMTATQNPMQQRANQFPILSTKLFAPAVRPDTIARPGLEERLNEGLSAKLVLISAPPGFGKTTAIVNWYGGIEDQGWRLGWISLDAGDNDPSRFLTYLTHGFKVLDDDLGDSALTMLQSTQRADWRVPLTILLNDIQAHDDPLLLVLDDYHEIVNDEIHDTLAFLIEHFPPNVRLIMTSRSEPPLPLASMRARRELVEIGIEQLRFSIEEATSFLNGVMRLDLTPEQVARIEDRTEGWIAGLLLAALSASDTDNPAEHITAFGGEHHFVFDYLAEEVLLRQAEDVQQFLLRTSVLDRMSAELCDAVTGRCDGQEMLVRLDDSNLFVVRLDQSRTWYRYHHLFSEFLSSRFRRQNLDAWRNAHLAACDYYERNGLFHQAIDHALQAEAFDRAVSSIEQTGVRTVSAGRAGTLRRWFNALPPEMMDQHVDLMLLDTWTNLMERDFDRVAERIAMIEGASLVNLTPTQNARLASARVTYALLNGEVQDAVELGEKALPNIDEDDVFSRSMIAVHLGTAYRMWEDLPKAVEMLTLGAKLCNETGNIPAWLIASSQRSVAWMTLGDLQLAHDAYCETIDYEQRHGLQNLGFAIASHLGLAEILREWNRLDEADIVVTHALDVLEQLDIRQELATRLYGLIILTRVRAAQERFDEALEVISQAVEEATDPTVLPWQYDRVEAIRARVLLEVGQTTEAERWAARMRASGPPQTFHYEQVSLILIRIEIGRGNIEGALGLIESARALAHQGSRRRRLIELDSLEAVARYADRDLEGARVALSRALESAEPDHYVRAFADERGDLAPVVDDLLKHRPEDARWSIGYLQQIRDAFGSIEMGSAASTDAATETLSEPLSERELEVLGLLATGLTNKEVAAQLFLSVGTIKRHTHNIYGKLGVNNRTQAIVRAGELNLLD